MGTLAASTPRSKRCDASECRPKRFAVRRTLRGSNVADSSKTLVVVAVISVRAPPITPASATAPRPSAITMSSGTSDRSIPSSVLITSPAAARRTTIPPSKFVGIEGVQRMPGLEHHVVAHVDQVRNRPDAACGKPHAHPQGTDTDAHATNDGRLVAWTGFWIANIDSRALRGRIHGRQLQHRKLPGDAKQGRDLAGDPRVRQCVGSVGGDVHFENVVGDSQGTGQIGPYRDVS